MQRRTLGRARSPRHSATSLGSPLALGPVQVKSRSPMSTARPVRSRPTASRPTGLMMGLEYATGGTMMVAGKKLVVIEKDDQGKPDVGKSLLAAAYERRQGRPGGRPDVFSSVALAMLPVAEEYKKILLVEPAVADSITGDKWNPYIFRTGRNSSQDAISNAVALDKPGTTIATLAQDYAFGRDGVKAFKEALKTAKLVHEEYLPAATTDFTAGAQRLIDKLKDQPGRKIIFIVWAGAGNPFKIADWT
jgi:branched-chain amino acid transport system substrate-binding protein